ncbi:uncharacterized protein LOC114580295 [Dendrobium catenatum]|uniref:uncharacterized protein LOC114580295 n=1 Tax=Dendrobium catenatum TaxID=906689 RepID=UPI0010A053CF|nr:uncharacterized protein LOC114580295 [Dendrobium catenatum]
MGSELVEEAAEKIRLIRDRLKDVQDRQQKYYDPKHRGVEFDVGAFVFLKVKPMKGTTRFGKGGKLSPRFIGPFEIVERIEKVAYRLALPADMSDIHNVFHVSLLRKWVTDTHQRISHEDIELQKNPTYTEEPERILDFDSKQFRNRQIPYVKVKWK